VVGFLNVLTGKLVRTVRQRGRGEDIAAGVQTLGDAKCRRLLIWDNAPPHQARVAREAAEELSVEIVKLPFRSPQLNPLEDLWRSLKAVVAANRAYDSVDELSERATDYLDGLSEEDVLRLSGLLSSKFNWLPT
jgi:transposase